MNQNPRVNKPPGWLQHTWNFKKLCFVTLHRPWCEAGTPWIFVNNWVALKAEVVLIDLWEDYLIIRRRKYNSAYIIFLWPFLVLNHGDPFLLLKSLICYFQVTSVVVWGFFLVEGGRVGLWVFLFFIKKKIPSKGSTVLALGEWV